MIYSYQDSNILINIARINLTKECGICQKEKIAYIFNKKFSFGMEDYSILPYNINFAIRFKKTQKEIVSHIPEGFKSNGRTVLPRIMKRFFKPTGNENDCIYLLHDYLYSKEYILNKRNNSNFINKKEADLILYSVCKFEYLIVRLFGFLFYGVD